MSSISQPQQLGSGVLRQHLLQHANKLIVSVGLIAFAIISFLILGAERANVRFEFDPSRLIDAAFAIQLHVGGALTSFALGTWLLLGVKGRTSHKVLGYTWVAAMMCTAVTSFFMIGLNGNSFSPIHGLSAWTVIGAPFGIMLARKKKISAHRKHMTGMFVGAMLLAGLFSFLPGRLMWAIFFSV